MPAYDVNPFQGLTPETTAFYSDAVRLLQEAEIPFLVGGAYAFACYTEIARHTKDFDLFICREDVEAAMAALSAGGYRTEITFHHWLAKALHGDESIDLIYRSGNGVSDVDAAWFDRAATAEVLGAEVLLCPPEEIIWTKAFVMERERYDGADVLHLLRSCGATLDWDRLLTLFGPHWRVLFSHLVLFGFVYPSERDLIPQALMATLQERLHDEQTSPPPAEKVCRGTLLSRAQYLVDVEYEGYTDARLQTGYMTPAEIDDWTEAIADDGDAQHPLS